MRIERELADQRPTLDLDAPTTTYRISVDVDMVPAELSSEQACGLFVMVLEGPYTRPSRAHQSVLSLDRQRVRRVYTHLRGTRIARGALPFGGLASDPIDDSCTLPRALWDGYPLTEDAIVRVSNHTEGCVTFAGREDHAERNHRCGDGSRHAVIGIDGRVGR
jgi:hypothetical protein